LGKKRKERKKREREEKEKKKKEKLGELRFLAEPTRPHLGIVISKVRATTRYP